MTGTSGPLKIARCRVSSVLNDDTKTYGSKCLLDDCDDTCWNSASGDEQWVLVQLEEPAKLARLELLFQGGFVAKQCDLCVKDDETGGWRPAASFYPADSNALQSFDLTKDDVTGREFTLYFRQPTDFYGRITLYRLSLFAS